MLDSKQSTNSHRQIRDVSKFAIKYKVSLCGDQKIVVLQEPSITNKSFTLKASQNLIRQRYSTETKKGSN